MNRRISGRTAVGMLFLLLLGLAAAVPTMNQFPSFIHAWSQTDWFSLAFGFQNNGFDLLHPESLLYNKQFPSYWWADDGSTVTAVDFPIHPYIASVLMHVLGTSEPWVFRVCTFAVSMVGIAFLFLLCQQVVENQSKSLFVASLAITSPLYVYYFNGFLPSTVSLSFVWIGLWAYFKYHSNGKIKYWYWAIAMLTLATLIRTSQAVPLVAVCCFEVFKMIFVHKKFTVGFRHIVPLVLSFLFIGAYMLWNSHLRATSGSLWMNSLCPVRSWDEASAVLDNMRFWWRYRYFSRIQQFCMVLVVLAAVLLAVAHRLGWKSRLAAKVSRLPLLGQLTWMPQRRDALGWFVAIYAFGSLLFFVAMLVQFKDHDYYFLDCFFTPIIIVIALCVRCLPCFAKARMQLLAVVAIVLLGGLMFRAHRDVNGFYQSPDDRAYRCAINFENSAQWLDSMGVLTDAKLLTLGAYPQNTPFIKMGRRGYACMWLEPQFVEKMLQMKFDYVVIENDILQQSLPEVDGALQQLKLIGRNGRLSLYVRKGEV